MKLLHYHFQPSIIADGRPENSELIVQGHTSRPQKYIIRRMINPEAGDGKFHPDQIVDLSFEGFGLFWEADEVARCLKGT